MRNPDSRFGFTLLEITVVLVVLVVAATLVAPALRVPEPPGSAWGGLVTDARATAVRRAEAMILQVDSTGAWTLAAENPASDSRVARGKLAGKPPKLLVVHFSPLGVCRVVRGEPTLLAHWDALRCASDL